MCVTSAEWKGVTTSASAAGTACGAAGCLAMGAHLLAHIQLVHQDTTACFSVFPFNLRH